MLKKIAPDKWRHFFAGIALGAALQAALNYLLTDSHLLAVIIALVLVVAVSYGFELFSKFTGRGHYDVIDAIASIIGGVVGMGIAFSFLYAQGFQS